MSAAVCGSFDFQSQFRADGHLQRLRFLGRFQAAGGADRNRRQLLNFNASSRGLSPLYVQCPPERGPPERTMVLAAYPTEV